MKALVAGATGQTGRRIVQTLVDRGIPVRSLVRNLETAKTNLPPGSELAVGDVLIPSTLTPAIADCTFLICATGSSPSLDPTGPYKVDYIGVKNLVDAAKANGVKHFVLVSSLCVSKVFHPLNLFWFILVWKKLAEGYLQKSGLTYTVVRPGGLLMEDNSKPILMSAEDTLFEGSIPRIKVAQVCVEALNQPSAQNRILEVIAKEEAAERSFEELFATLT
ncbi:MAG: SDR family oxidoreductase [Leptolyngbyaceae cyanobacterium MO_188.B28]|nr:SDR family oxidoreductase [Leptolyngbyaceae cyanobacterium MO_188.B28]